MMELYIETLTGAAFELRVSPFETILSVKAKIQRLEGIPISQQHLIWQSVELEDDYCLHDYSIQDGATLKLVLAMRGGPINTRRVAMDDPALREMTDYMESNRDEILDKLPGNNRQVTLLVYREGDQLNFFRVVDRGDGTLTPLSESLSGTSVYNLYEDEEEEVATGSDKHVEENLRMREKMRLLRKKMEELTVTKKPKKKLPHPPSGRPKSRSRRHRHLAGSAGRSKHHSGHFNFLPQLPSTHPSSNQTTSTAYSTIQPSNSNPDLSITGTGSKVPQAVNSYHHHHPHPPSNAAQPSPRLSNHETGTAMKLRTGNAAVNNNNVITCNNNYLQSSLHQGHTKTTDASSNVQSNLNAANAKETAALGKKIRTNSGKSQSTFRSSEIFFRPTSGHRKVMLKESATVLEDTNDEVFRSDDNDSKLSQISVSPEANSISPGAQSQTPLISAPGLSPRSSVMYRPKTSSRNTHEDIEAILETDMLSPENGDENSNGFRSDSSVSKERTTPAHRTVTSSLKRGETTLSTVKENQPLPARHVSTQTPIKALLNERTAATRNAGKMSPSYKDVPGLEGLSRPRSGRHANKQQSSPGTGGILLESLTSQEARGFLRQTSLERLGSSRIGNYVRRSASKSRSGFLLNGDRIYSPDGTRLSARLRRTSGREACLSPRLPPVKHKKKSKRCFICAKKTGLATSYQCRCGNNFCATHRYAETHGCTYDYKSEGRKLLEQNNPVVTAPKLPKI